MFCKAESNQIKKNKLWFCQYICTYGSILGVLPPCHFESKNVNKLSEIHKYYSLLIVSLMLVAYGYSTNGRFTETYPKFPSGTLMFTDFILSFLLTVTNLTSVILPSLLHPKVFCSFLELLYTYNNFTKSISCKSYYIIFIVGHIILFIVFCYDYYVWFYLVTLYKYRYYCFRILQNYYVFIIVFIIHMFVSTLKQRFKKINELLESVLSACTSPNMNQSKSIHLNNTRTAKQASQLYVALVQHVSLFNDGFGWQMLILAATIVTYFLNSLDLLILFGVLQKESEISGLLYELIVLTICWSVVQLVRI